MIYLNVLHDLLSPNCTCCPIWCQQIMLPFQCWHIVMAAQRYWCLFKNLVRKFSSCLEGLEFLDGIIDLENFCWEGNGAHEGLEYSADSQINVNIPRYTCRVSPPYWGAIIVPFYCIVFWPYNRLLKNLW